MEKVITQTGSSNSHEVGYKANRPAHYAPVIVESFEDDEGNIQHILASGNQMSDLCYMAMWGKPKGVVNRDLKYKGENPDKTKDFYK